MKTRESYYDDTGHLTGRGVRVTEGLRKRLRKLFRAARTPRESMDLERALRGEISIACSLRILGFRCKPKAPRRTSGSGRRRGSRGLLGRRM